MTLKRKLMLYVVIAAGVGAVVIRLFFWPKRGRVMEYDFDVDSGIATQGDFIIKAESISGND